MKKSVGFVTRILLVLCAVALVIVLFVPIWKIDLAAPQYPEGLFLLIHADKLAGNVDIINGLNHYIGMKTLHASDFIEFTVLPYIIGFFAVLFLAAAVIGKRRFLHFTFVLFLLFGIVAMVDFWKWEYNYGHNLNPNAAIIVPGMSYQPPLIGYKQLLNFSAYSMPDIGGWLFIAVGILALVCVILEWRRRKIVVTGTTKVAAAIMFLFTLNSCTTDPEPFKMGSDQCTFCKMTISDNRYGAEIITKKGKILKFDDAHCILSYIGKDIQQKDIAAVYFADFAADHKLVDANKAFFLKSALLQSPMAGNVAAFSTKNSLDNAVQQFNGTAITWNDLLKK
jgi:copper chaperone NosL